MVQLRAFFYGLDATDIVAIIWLGGAVSHPEIQGGEDELGVNTYSTPVDFFPSMKSATICDHDSARITMCSLVLVSRTVAASLIGGGRVGRACRCFPVLQSEFGREAPGVGGRQSTRRS